MEFVLAVQNIGDLLHPKDFINIQHLKGLIVKYPMVVPFIGDEVMG